jgi:hypothetical protein
MFGFLTTIALLAGVLFTMPYWQYNRQWGFGPFFIMSLVTVVFGSMWLMKWF